MPMFSYKCEKGHEFEALVLGSEKEPTHCREATSHVTAELLAVCDAPLTKQLTAPASKFPGADSWR